MGGNLRRLAENRYVYIDNPAVPLPDAPGGFSQEDVRCGASPLWVGRRKMLADISVRDRAENRIRQSMQADICIRMADEASVVGDPNTA